jgi:hypothetical protein
MVRVTRTPRLTDDPSMSRRLCVVLLSGILLLSLGATGASAKHGENEHTRRGACTLGVARYSLTVKHTSGPNLQVRFVITNAGVGSTWQLFGSDDGNWIFSVSKVALTNSVSVTRTIPDLDGPDTVKATASNSLATETCAGTVTI